MFIKMMMKIESFDENDYKCARTNLYKYKIEFKKKTECSC